MKISFFLTFITTIQVSAVLHSQDVKLNLSVKDKSLIEVIRMIEKQSDYRFFFSDNYQDLNNPVSLDIKDKSINEVLSGLLDKKAITYKVLKNNIVVITPTDLAQVQKVSGIVSDAGTGEPLPGVNVVVEGTTNGVITDINGRYTIDVLSNNDVLSFSFVGYVIQKITVGTKSQIDVSLSPELKNLDEVVVVGYGVQKKSLVTGAISKVNGDDLLQAGNLRANQMLQGKASGVVITNNSGQPGSGVSVRIRGIGTNGNAEPLYLVDGLPMSDAGIDFINPSDIESMEILKDAASASIYGARGANGVVLITTKQGKAGKMQVSYDAYYGQQNPWRKLDMLGSKEYMMLINEAAANASQPEVFSQTFMDTLKYNTNWQDEMFYYNAPIQNHVITLTGGDEKTLYNSSISYFGQDGIVAKGKSNYQKITYRLNVTRKFNVLEVGSNLNYANITNKGIDVNNQYGGSSLIEALNTPPVVPVKNPDGTWGTPTQILGRGIQEITNPVAMLSYLNNTTNTNKFIGSAYAKLDFGKLFGILQGLDFRTNYSGEISYVNGRSYTPQYNLDATHQNTTNGVSENIDKYLTWNIDNVLTYDKTFQKHHFTLMLGQTGYQSTHTNVTGSKNQVIFNDLDHAYLDNAQSVEATTAGGYSSHTLASYFGRLNYDYQNKYLLTAVVRKDGSSRFGSNNKYGYFPSVSLGWVLSREDFLKNLESTVSFMKIRGSWGQNGNEEIGDFKYTSTISTGNIYFFGTDKTLYNGAQPSVIPNPDLKWETSEQLDLGLDLNLFQNKINFTGDYYNKTTKDWLLQAPAPAMIGNTAPTVNGGNIRNRGVELELGYKENFRKFHFEITLTGGFNQNRVMDIPNIDKKLTGGNGGFGQGGILVAKVGEPMASFYGVKTAGLFQNKQDVLNYTHKNTDGTTSLIQPSAQPGDVRFVDQNNDGKIDDKDRVNLGNPFPDFTGGVNLSLSWLGFDFNMFWYTSQGNKVWDATRRYDINYANFRSDALNRWVGEGTSNSYPRVTLNDANNNWSTASDMFVKDASFVRLKNTTLGYTIPVKITQFLKIQKLRIYISAENLLTFTNYRGFDPEIGGGVFNNAIDYGNYPQARTIIGGVNIAF